MPPPTNPSSAPAFMRLRETCLDLYPDVNPELDIALRTVLESRLALPARCGDTNLIGAPEAAAKALNAAFRTAEYRRASISVP
jgi:hypothetical protein